MVEGAKKEVATKDDPKFLTQTTGRIIEPSLQETLEEEETTYLVVDMPSSGMSLYKLSGNVEEAIRYMNLKLRIEA